MREYMLMVFAVCAIVSVLGFLSYRRGDVATRSALSVLVLYVTLTPILSSLGSLDGTDGVRLPEFDVGDYGEDYAEYACSAFVDGIELLIVNKYSLDGDDVRVLVEGFDFQNMCAERIRVVLTGAAALGDGKGMAKYITELGYGRCEVEIGIK